MKKLLVVRQARSLAGILVVRSRAAVPTPAAASPDATATSADAKRLSSSGQHVKAWESVLDLNAPGVKKFDPVEAEDGRTIDYRNVTIKGYLSTFKNVTEADREGDYVEKGAFAETIKSFMRNPVLLIDHWNRVNNLAGQFTVVREDSKGLYIEAKISEAPGATDIRFKVAEGSLRTLSMGGRFHYKDDGRGIFKVDLYEGSLTPVPMNPDALFSIRELSDEEAKSPVFWPSQRPGCQHQPDRVQA